MSTRLQIKLLSASGELINCVNCPAGRITVLRASSSKELKPYKRALAGVPGPERFAIHLDGQPFAQSEHTLIGFGESFVESSETVSEYLRDIIPAATLESSLLSYGLEKTINRPLCDLNEDEERRIRLLAATYETEKVLILNTPFEPIRNQWRERYAELLTRHTRQTGGIVVVPELSCRPEQWVQNEMILRVQVGENIQQTIGFASTAAPVQSIIDQVRKEIQGTSPESPKQTEEPASPDHKTQEDNREVSEQPTPTKNPHPKTTQKMNLRSQRKQSMAVRVLSSVEQIAKRDPRHMRAHLTTLCAILFIPLIALAYFLFNSSGETSTPAIQTVVKVSGENKDSSQQTTASHQNIEKQLPSPLQTVLQQKTDPIDQPAQEKLILDSYPYTVRQAVQQVFENPGFQNESTKTSALPTGTNKTPKTTAPSAGGLLSALQQASGSGKDSNTPSFAPPQGVFSPASPSSDFQDLPAEERREMIRQRFLEAIQRASKQDEFD